MSAIRIIDRTRNSNKRLQGGFDLARGRHMGRVRGLKRLLRRREENPSEPFDAFRHAYMAVATIGRKQGLDKQRALSWWAEECEAKLRLMGRSFSLNSNAVMIAILASGDVAYSHLGRWPFEIGIGLQHGGGGIPATDAWRTVLSTGSIRPASEGLMRHQEVSPSIVRVFGADPKVAA